MLVPTAPFWIRGDLYPVTILCSRYGGSYEGSPWVAFHDYLEGVVDAQGDDLTCASFFRIYERLRPIGRGQTPQEAYDNLKERYIEEFGPPPPLREEF